MKYYYQNCVLELYNLLKRLCELQSTLRDIVSNFPLLVTVIMKLNFSKTTNTRCTYLSIRNHRIQPVLIYIVINFFATKSVKIKLPDTTLISTLYINLFRYCAVSCIQSRCPECMTGYSNVNSKCGTLYGRQYESIILTTFQYRLVHLLRRL